MKFIFDLNYFRSNLNELNVKLEKAIDFLNDYLHDVSLMFTETNGICYSALIFIGKTIHSFEMDYKIFTTKNFDLILSKIMFYLFEIRNELKFEILVNPINAEHGKTVDVLRLFVLNYTLYISNQVFRNSEKFCTNFVQNLGLKSYVLFISDEAFIEKNKSVEICDLNEFTINMLDYLALNLTCLRYTCDINRKIWIDLDVINSLLKISRIKESIKLTAFTTLAYILDDSQVENLNELDSILNILFELLIQARMDFIFNTFRRCKVKLEIKGKEFNDASIHCVLKSDKSLAAGLRTLLESLKRFAVNDKIKCEIYFQRDLRGIFRLLLTKGKKNHY